MIKSIGITTYEFHKMIIFESLYYACKGILYGGMLALFIHYTMYLTLFAFHQFPFKELCIASGIIIIICVSSAWISIRKMEKEGIMETIRNKNI